MITFNKIIEIENEHTHIFNVNKPCNLHSISVVPLDKSEWCYEDKFTLVVEIPQNSYIYSPTNGNCRVVNTGDDEFLVYSKNGKYKLITTFPMFVNDVKEYEEEFLWWMNKEDGKISHKNDDNYAPCTLSTNHHKYDMIVDFPIIEENKYTNISYAYPTWDILFEINRKSTGRAKLSLSINVE